MSRGVVIFGVNNDRIEYIRLAVLAAAFVKRNMGEHTQVCIITDKYSIDQYKTEGGEYTAEFKKWVDDVIVIEPGAEANERTYRDTRYYTFKANFKNESRSTVYDLSPYDETLLIDCDYLVCNDALNNVWGSTEDVMINKNAIGLMHNQLSAEEIRLNAYGIRMYWATVIYFKKGKKAKMLFDLVEHVKENWEFYKLTYEFPGYMFRNDYAFSIAIHMLNGFIEDDFAVDLPDRTILTALDFDQFYGITDKKTLHFFANDFKDTWKFFATRLSGNNVHCMNKLSILNNYNEIMEVMNEADA